jgi:ribonucleoside-triphosphate reductase (thioredoxin)
VSLENKILSDVVVFSKYAKYLKDFKRRETWEELTLRNADMHMRKYPEIAKEIYDVYNNYVIPKKLLPSMRSLQFGGKAIERNPARIYNCAYLPVEHPDAFSETMFLLLGGTGVGYSVQWRHVNKLPIISGPKPKSRRYVIGDSIEGWADAVKVLVESYFYNKLHPVFDFGDIRDKGTELVTSGGKAPGPDPLRVCLAQVEGVLNRAKGRRLKPIEAHDIQCFLADAVLAGGIRRAAMISLFSPDDIEMITCKSGDWWELNPQRSRANNSVTLLRQSTTMEEFFSIWTRVKESGAGEPGIYWTNNLDWGTNPLI